MRDFLARRRPSPPMAIAFIALLAALSGTAIALPGTNTVDSGDIINGTIRGKDIHRNAVTGKKVKNGSLTGADIKDNSLTGSDVNESTLGQVPSANAANTANTANSANTAGFANNAGAVNGTGVRRLSVHTGPNTSATVLNLNGLTLTYSCDAGSQGTLEATTSVDNSDLYFWGYDTDNASGSAAGITGSDLEDGGFDLTDTVNISDLVGDGDSDTALGQIEYYHPGGVSGGVSVQYTINSFADPGGDFCQFSGFAIG
jgi:hypothetical protein